jgi:hypothetical protein
MRSGGNRSEKDYRPVGADPRRSKVNDGSERIIPDFYSLFGQKHVEHKGHTKS